MENWVTKVGNGAGRGYETTPKWEIKLPQPPFWPFLTPRVSLCNSGVVLSPLLRGGVGGGFITSKGGFYPRKGVVLSPQGGGFIPLLGLFVGGAGKVITFLWLFHSPFSVISSVNLEPWYRKTSCLRSICCEVRRTPLAMTACSVSISGMELGEVMEGQGTTNGFTHNVLLHIALCICVIGCLTWLVTILQVGRWDFRHGLGLLFIKFDMHCFCGSIAQAAVVCCVMSLLLWWHKTTPG